MRAYYIYRRDFVGILKELLKSEISVESCLFLFNFGDLSLITEIVFVEILEVAILS